MAGNFLSNNTCLCISSCKAGKQNEIISVIYRVFYQCLCIRRWYKYEQHPYIYPEDAKDITVRVNNESASPVFVQYWLDAGDSETLPATPFELTPPVSRINPGAEQILRIRLTDKTVCRQTEKACGG